MGIDVALFSLEVLRQQTDQTRLVLGVPILAVEILSPGDKHEETHEKIVEYLRTHVKLVWEVDPDFRTVRVYRPDQEPVMFNRRQTLTADDILPPRNFYNEWTSSINPVATIASSPRFMINVQATVSCRLIAILLELNALHKPMGNVSWGGVSEKAKR